MRQLWRYINEPYITFITFQSFVFDITSRFLVDWTAVFFIEYLHSSNVSRRRPQTAGFLIHDQTHLSLTGCVGLTFDS